MNAVHLLVALNGRVSRTTYWLAVTPLVLAGLYGWLLSYTADYRAETLGLALVLVIVWPLVAVHVKRWHDRGKSGWWMWVVAIPGAGQVWLFIECGFLPGTAGPNRFGEPPRGLIETEIDDDAKSDLRTRARAGDAKDEPSPLGSDLVNLMRIAGLLIRSDPRAQAAKTDYVRRYLTDHVELDDALVDHALTVVDGTRFSTDSFEKQAQGFKLVHGQDAEVLNVVSDFLFELAMIDGSLSGEEEILLSQVHSVFGFSGSAYASYRYSDEQQSRRRQQQHRPHQQRDRAQEPTGPSRDKERHYGAILGLEGRIGRSEIKRAFRELVKQYHPDKVAHLGPKLKKAADLEMKNINEAYDYFRKRYNL